MKLIHILENLNFMDENVQGCRINWQSPLIWKGSWNNRTKYKIKIGEKYHQWKYHDKYHQW